MAPSLGVHALEIAIMAKSYEAAIVSSYSTIIGVLPQKVVHAPHIVCSKLAMTPENAISRGGICLRSRVNFVYRRVYNLVNAFARWPSAT